MISNTAVPHTLSGLGRTAFGACCCGLCLSLRQPGRVRVPVRRLNGRLSCGSPRLVALGIFGALTKLRSAADDLPYTTRVALGLFGQCSAQASKVAPYRKEKQQPNVLSHSLRWLPSFLSHVFWGQDGICKDVFCVIINLLDLLLFKKKKCCDYLHNLELFSSLKWDF